MKKITTFIIAAFSTLLLQPAMAQNVVFNAYFDSLHIDSREIRIGEQVKLTLELAADNGCTIEAPAMGKVLAGGVEVLGSATSRTENNGRSIFKGEYTLTSFKNAQFAIPPITATVNGDTYYTNPTNLIVNTVPIDTTNLKNIKGPRGIWNVQLTWNEYRDAVYLGFLLMLLLLLLAWIVVRYIKNKPIIRIVRIKPRQPSHFTALKKMDEIKSEGVQHRAESAKDYYTRLTDALREYMCNRYNFNATDMTTTEIIENLLKFNDKEAIKELREILEVADLVKFAKLQPSLNENDRNMLNAIEFINATKNVEEENQKPVEKKVVNERSLNQKRILIASIVIVLVAVVAIAALLIADLGNMFS